MLLTMQTHQAGPFLLPWSPVGSAFGPYGDGKTPALQQEDKGKELGLGLRCPLDWGVCSGPDSAPAPSEPQACHLQRTPMTGIHRKAPGEVTLNRHVMTSALILQEQLLSRWVRWVASKCFREA